MFLELLKWFAGLFQSQTKDSFTDVTGAYHQALKDLQEDRAELRVEVKELRSIVEELKHELDDCRSNHIKDAAAIAKLERDNRAQQQQIMQLQYAQQEMLRRLEAKDKREDASLEAGERDVQRRREEKGKRDG